jgi:glycosyltransferase involved in cell wall biosynthesis
MACATPLVATTAGALPEVVGPDGVSALHVPPGDPEALAASVGRLLDDPALAARLGAAGRAASSSASRGGRSPSRPSPGTGPCSPPGGRPC